MGIPALNMMSDLVSSVVAGDLSPDMLNSLKSGKVPPDLAHSLATSVSHMSAVALIGGIMFSGIGTVVMIYGKKRMNVKNMLIGALLFGYPFLVYSTALTYGIGTGLCVLLYLLREKDNRFTSMD